LKAANYTTCFLNKELKADIERETCSYVRVSNLMVFLVNNAFSFRTKRNRPIFHLIYPVNDSKVMREQVPFPLNKKLFLVLPMNLGALANLNIIREGNLRNDINFHNPGLRPEEGTEEIARILKLMA
jgi:hypothetical protein